MKITYDPEVDALYMQLIDGDHECRTVRLSDEVALDFSSEETLVGIEILDARRLLGKGKLPRLVVDNVALSPTSAARSNGKGKATSRRGGGGGGGRKHKRTVTSKNE